jgi:hypothetical protein
VYDVRPELLLMPIEDVDVYRQIEFLADILTRLDKAPNRS